MRTILGLAGLAFAAAVSTAAAEVQDCIAITALPAVITVQGVHCFKQDLATSMTSGRAITISTNNVIIDMNGFKLGGLAAGPNTLATAIYAQGRQNITSRNGAIRGFGTGIEFSTFIVGENRGHLVENMRIESSRFTGISLQGLNSIIRNNIIYDTGGGIGTDAAAISLNQCTSCSVAGNVIGGVKESAAARGMFLTQTSASVIRDNEIRNVDEGTERIGIDFSSGGRVAIERNSVINNTTGTVGIRANGTSDACIENFVTGFTTRLTGCTFSEGNRDY